ncbi:MAG: acyl transferase [Bacteroidota bacterium]
MDALVHDVFNISSEDEFTGISLEIFRFQAVNNPVYSWWIKELGVDYRRVEEIDEIPFLPISVFRNHKVLTGRSKAEKVFVSSGTTGRHKSKHYVADPGIYRKSFTSCFRIFYGEISDYVILGLLPSYLEQGGSSLVYMVNGLIEMSGSEFSGFFMDDYRSLKASIELAGEKGKRIILIGVSFALLDFAEYSATDLGDHIVMETGGMKGRREEMTREELHSILKKSFKLDHIHSEYGMTELLSQAYSSEGGVYKSPPWMKVIIRDPHDPFSFYGDERTGGVNVIDLANIYSCSFIETDDLGVAHPDGSFEIVGRFDSSDIRGCNLLV